MTVHQCPKCELRFAWKTELDDHCRTDHPQFRHDYPVGHPNHPNYPDANADPSRPNQAPGRAPS
jgi:hypothetical protein